MFFKVIPPHYNILCTLALRLPAKASKIKQSIKQSKTRSPFVSASFYTYKQIEEKQKYKYEALKMKLKFGSLECNDAKFSMFDATEFWKILHEQAFCKIQAPSGE